ncbi:MAG: TIGR03790 family protein [Thermodesulfobacteriota bacterium]|nr:TIGR03790 family protein [Thermodesulfobacteriota bacterium]
MNKTNRFFLLFLMFIFSLLVVSDSAVHALEPDEVLVLANRNAAKSKGLAEYYMKKRAIPTENLLLLWITDKETCTRQAYEKKVVVPVRRFFKENSPGSRIRCIVSMFGLPLRIGTPGLTDEEKAILDGMEKDKAGFEKLLKNKKNNKKDEQEKNHGHNHNKSESKENILEKKLSSVKKQITDFKRGLDRVASFDSELTLVKKDGYDLKMWIPNPFYLGFANKTLETGKSEVLMTCRLDGASSIIVKRIINDSIMAEKNGLSGNACFDARWKDPGEKKVSGYAFYDRSIHRAADYLENENLIKVKKDDRGGLFQPGDCPDTALYCGWYSLAKYVDAFTWQPGSVGYHIASSECVTLKRDGSRVWCKKMLDKGIAATVGPVGEPYVQSFPVPEIFFRYLAEGYLTLAESYIISLPYLSWKMVLVGDPLYRLNLN